ncbi:endonuclease NucS [Nakamurella sp.]|uniref:endonuclease NucS n=1 Tax=Nakamurella sp. TaxID=1869182 RepID=UPI003B3B72EC
MRLVVARCSVDYVGRLTAHLDPAVRLLMVKADGSVLVHADGGSYKPLNWMSPPCRLSESDGRWTVENKAGERLLITLDEVLHDSWHDLGADPGLVKDGVEAHLQVLLAEHVGTLGAGWTLVRREYPTPIGPVDLMCRDGGAPVEVVADGDRPVPDGGSGVGPDAEPDAAVEVGPDGPPVVIAGAGAVSGRPGYVAVEIKRRATIDAVEQLTRYLEYLNRDPLLAPVSGVLAAQSIAPQARTLAQTRGIRCVVLDYDELRGIEVDGTLF